MNTGWLEIPLEDYEGHMSLPHIGQARMLADELEAAVAKHAPRSVAVVGCAGGNGFDRLAAASLRRIVGIDINPAFVAAVRSRYAMRLPQLELHVADIQAGVPGCAPVELLFAGLILEYVDVAATLLTLRSLCMPGGTLVVVLQQPHAAAAKVSTSVYASLQSLASEMRLVQSSNLQAFAEAAGFEFGAARSLTLPAGKTFTIMDFRVDFRGGPAKLVAGQAKPASPHPD